ncbi:MAG: hypothetical protein IJ262_07030 [Clostridia bacterium]|nr:hypothetical protein [Clostridia bacterium]
MTKKFKKVLALLLSVLTVFASCAVAASAAEAEEEKYPAIYVAGYGQHIFSEKNNHNSKVLYPTGVDVAEKVKEAVLPCLFELAIGSFSNNYDAYCDAIYNSIAPIYDDLRLNPDGTLKDNSGGWANAYAQTFGNYGMIRFSYDWRLSPETLAHELHSAIEIVLDKYDAEKVNLVGRCYGANIVSAYLELYKEEAVDLVDSAIFYVPSTEGIGLIGTIFSGQIEINAENLDVFVSEIMKYLDVMEDGLVKDFLNVMVSVFEQASLFELSADKLQNLIDSIKNNLIPRLVRDSYGSFPSFWSMIPDEYLNAAIDFTYNTAELKETYKGTIDIIRSWNENVQKKSRANLLSLKDEINLNVISKYNLPALPVMGEGCANSDAVAETHYTSFGATAADFGTRLSAEYIEAMDEDAKAFLSADEKIDASTCVLPEKTWFIKNSYHDHFPESVDALMNEIFISDGMTVFTNEEYPQFLDADVDGKTLTPVTGVDKDIPESDSTEGRINLLVKFIIFVVKLFNSILEKIGA